MVVEDPLKLFNTRTPSKKTNTRRHKNTHTTEWLMVLETPAQHDYGSLGEKWVRARDRDRERWRGVKKKKRKGEASSVRHP